MWQKIKEKFLNKKFLTFGIIGAINTVLAQLCYLVYINWISPGLSSIAGDCTTMIISYFLNMRFTYHEKISWKSAITFPLSYIPGFLISALIVVIIVDIMHLPKEYAKLISLPITIPLNFVCMSLIVKLTSKKKEEA